MRINDLEVNPYVCEDVGVKFYIKQTQYQHKTNIKCYLCNRYRKEAL